jgi:integrase
VRPHAEVLRRLYNKPVAGGFQPPAALPQAFRLLARTGKRRVARRPEVEPFTAEEVDRVALELGPLLGPMVVFMAETGLRPGEVAALEYRDINEGVVSVRRVYSDGRVKEPKTERSRRRVPLTTRAASALDALPRRLDSRLVFPAPGGGPLNFHNFAVRDWHPALEAAGLPPRRVYSLRHGFASNALAAGISLYELSRYMGASVRVIEAHYAHLLGDAEDAARAKLDARARLVWASSGRRARSAEVGAINSVRGLAGLRETGATGLEPATSGVTGRRSNQLNYAPWAQAF